MVAEKIRQNLRTVHAPVAATFLAGLAVSEVAWNIPLVWDSSVYTAMGKHLFSLGKIGFWEVMRPPTLPLIIGTLWKAGLPPEMYRIASYAISALSVYEIYSLVKSMEGEETAIAAAGITASSGILLYFSANPLTGVLASALVMLTLYLVYTEKYVSSGLVAGAAFLTRFPAALVLVAVAAFIIYTRSRSGEYADIIVAGSKIALGFAVTVLPYLAAAQIVYGSFLEPFTTAFSVTAAAGSTYTFGLEYFILSLKGQPLLLLAIPGLYIALRNRSKANLLMFSALAVFYGFFTYFPHKIERYTLLFLPMFSYFAGLAVHRAIEVTQEREMVPERLQKNMQWLLAGAFAVSVLLSGSAVYSQFDYAAPAQESFFDQVRELNGTVASNDPRVNINGEFVYIKVSPARLHGIWEKRNEADYFAVNSCQWYCSNVGPGCERDIDEFESNVTRLDRLYQENSTQCEYSVYQTR